MDWWLDGENVRAVTALRHEVIDYLRRHAEAESDFDDAELVISELLGNTARHAAGPVWVSLSWLDEVPTLTVSDLGPGFDPALLGGEPLELTDPLAESGRGLFLISHLAPSLTAEAREAAGMRVSVTLPVARHRQVSHDRPRRSTGALPDLSEALPEGGFGRESFLRALVVQLAQTIERDQGPDVAEAAVAQVGADVGGQMEAESRRALNLVGEMSAEQMSQCYVRLKHAIDGGFYVIEANEDRIVLGNTRCPFGDVVTRAPSLCRMTSSVFGGIAARNTNGPVTVLLEERIAVGDPGCRVVVDLKPDARETPSPLAHRYEAPVEVG